MKFLFLVFATLFFLSPGARATELEDLPWDHSTFEDSGNFAVQRLLGTFQIRPIEKTFHAHVPNCAKGISAVKLSVRNAGVTVSSIGAKFSDGKERVFRVNRSWNAGTESSWLNLSLLRFADPRCVVEVFASARSDGGIATVQVWGR